jgi:hypothetical protein
MLIALAMPAQAQINPSAQWGWSTAGGSGGTPTGPTNPGAYGYGTSTAAGSGGIPTGPLNPNAYGWGTSLGAGSGAIPTGPTLRGLGPIPPDLRIMADRTPDARPRPMRDREVTRQSRAHARRSSALRAPCATRMLRDAKQYLSIRHGRACPGQPA